VSSYTNDEASTCPFLKDAYLTAVLMTTDRTFCPSKKSQKAVSVSKTSLEELVFISDHSYEEVATTGASFHNCLAILMLCLANFRMEGHCVRTYISTA
jgi:hypothetical protein